MSLRTSGSSIPVLMGQVPVKDEIHTRTLALSDYIEKRYPFVDYEIKLDNEESMREGTLHVLEKIFPERNFKDCKTSQYTDGITNKLFKIVTKTSDFPPVLVRVYGLNTEMLIDREQEILTMELLSEAGIAQPIYGRFTNGLCYGFAQGKTFEVEEMKCPTKLPLVAKELAKFHAVNVLGSAYREPSVFITINNWVDVATEAEFSTSPTASRKPKTSLGEVMSEFEILKNDIQPFLSKAKICFCHNDLLCKNILYHEENDSIQVRFIDYEYGHYNYAAFDIGNHFNEMMGYDVNTDLYPNRETQISFLTAYVTAFREITDYDHSTLNPNHDLSIEEEVEILYIQTNKFALISHFFWAIWARVQAVYSDISDFDYYEYSNTRIAAYYKFKDEFLALGK